MDTKFEHLLERERLHRLYTGATKTHKIIYIHANTGYGKTASVMMWLSKEGGKCGCFSADEGDYLEKMQAENAFAQDMVVIDNFSYVKEEEQECLFQSLVQSSAKIILIGRTKPQPFLTPFIVTGQMKVIGEEVLVFTKSEMEAFFKKHDLLVDDETTEEILKDTKGVPLVLVLGLRHIENTTYSKEVYDKTKQDYYNYLDYALYQQLTEVEQNLLLDLVVEQTFHEDIAIALTGAKDIKERLLKIRYFENILTYQNPDMFSFSYPVIYEYFCYKQKQKRSKESVLQLYQKIGQYYELKGDFLQAMHYYSLGKNSDKLSALLIENSKRNASVARFYQADAFYFQLSKEQIMDSPELMYGMSLLHSVKFCPEESEYWYEQLKTFVQTVGKKDSRYKTARDKLFYLEIALPHRGTKNLLNIIKLASNALFDRKNSMIDLSITGDMPGVMNGGLDFSDWSKNDRFLHGTLRITLEMLLGRMGVGLTDAGLGESLFEKTQDLNFTEPLTYLNSALMEVTRKGTKQMEFAILGAMARIFVASGSMASAVKMINGFKNSILHDSVLTMMPNVEALLCLFALQKGDEKTVAHWSVEHAPDEHTAFYITTRYQYLIKVRCYILAGNHNEALSLLDRLKIYFESYHRPYCAIQTMILRAVVHYRMGIEIWKEELQEALKRCESFSFTRIIADEGMAVLEPLLKLEYTGDKGFFKKVLALTRQQAILYPHYLHEKELNMDELTNTEKSVLAFMLQGMTNEKISTLLGITLRTVKFHTGNIYAKLNVKNRAEAIVKAKKLGLS